MSTSAPNDNHTVTHTAVPNVPKECAAPTSYAVLLKLQGTITQAECDEARCRFAVNSTGPSSATAMYSRTLHLQNSKSCVNAKKPFLKPEASREGEADVLSGVGAWCDDRDSADMPRSVLEQSLINGQGSALGYRECGGKSKPM
ncbi:hypothetical protein LTR10_013912 [Elasticomyces elasticus]|nr:hypothetical protein LTR10_013912 [Elasticomyces elasticus]KAK4974506.1 hypothetical protein LTR42_005151 [Elasticomyces elasticus]